jgi:hypothetical protein
MADLQDDERDIEARSLVRSFSDHLDSGSSPSDELTQALKVGIQNSDDQDAQRRRELFQASDEGGKVFNRVRLECDLVTKAWEQFISELPKAEDASSRAGRIPWGRTKKTTPTDKLLQDLKVSTVEDVVNEVAGAQEKWKSQDRLLGGQAQKRFHSVCKSLLNHNTIFDAVPSQNNYAATLCGSIRMIIKVCQAPFGLNLVRAELE